MTRLQLRRNLKNVTTRALYFPTDTEYIAAIGADYPDAGIANWEEARCLFSDHGYNMWNRTWDAKMRRRNLPGDFQEEWQHGADGCGVHATGATFQNQDAFQYADWKDDTEWITI